MGACTKVRAVKNLKGARARVRLRLKYKKISARTVCGRFSAGTGAVNFLIIMQVWFLVILVRMRFAAVFGFVHKNSVCQSGIPHFGVCLESTLLCFILVLFKISYLICSCLFFSSMVYSLSETICTADVIP